MRKEAVLSSQIEGAQSTLEELLLFENEQVSGVPTDADAREVSSYVAAMQHGLQNIKSKKGLPLSLRLLKEIPRNNEIFWQLYLILCRIESRLGLGVTPNYRHIFSGIESDYFNKPA